MKRSKINELIRDATSFLEEQKFSLPPFVNWSEAEWKRELPAAARLVQRQMGWDVTDFGHGDFGTTGLVLFTIRNGSPHDLERGGGRLYAEKVLFVNENQVTPLHFHYRKFEDIINRGGGDLIVQVHSSTPDGQLSDNSVEVEVDAQLQTVGSGETIRLRPGQSITLVPGCYHSFWAEQGRVLGGEVSMVNDDHLDNHFYEHTSRFPAIEEDEAPYRLLVGDYASRLTL